MDYSIIIINYKTPQLTLNCIDSILALPNPENKEIIVIDNASEDASLSLLREKFGGKIKLIANKDNLGFSKANNQGAKIASNHLLLFLNSDTIVKDDIFTSCKEIFLKDNNVAIVSPKLLLSNGEPQPYAYGHFPTLWRLITRKTKREIKIDKEAKELEIDWLSGCALIIKKEVFEEVKGFDENFFLYFEDVDLCKRVKDKSYKIIINLKSSIIHLGGKSIEQHKTRKKYYYQSQDYYFKKHRNYISYLGVKMIKKLALG